MRRLLPTMTALLMSTALSACSAPDGPAARVPLGDPVALAQGRAIFQAHCALCHGAGGDGHGRRHEGFKRPPPDFTSTAWRAEATPRGVFDTVTGGIQGTTMGAWAGTLTEGERAAVTAYVLSLAEAQR